MSTELRESIRLPKATIIDLSFYPGEKGVNAVLVVKAPLSHETARILKCEERFFTINEAPYTDFQGRLTLKKVVKSCRIDIGDPSTLSLMPDMVWKFSAGLEKDATPSITCRIHLDSQYRHVLVDMLNGLNKDEFSLAIVALQSQLFVEDEPAASGTGDRIDMTAKKDDDRQMVIGRTAEPTEAEASGEAIEPGNTLASARAMAGTTEQAKRGRGRPPKVAAFEQIQ